MTMQAPRPHSYAFFFARLDQKAKEECLKVAAERITERLKQKRQALKEALGFRTPPARVRLQAYRMRAPDRWSMLEQTDPREYDSQQRDWRQLEIQAMNKPEWAAQPEADQTAVKQIIESRRLENAP